MRLFFATDLHGSNVCWRKFLNALPIYRADAAIAMGDLTGKILVPLVGSQGGPWETTFLGRPLRVSEAAELAQLKKTIENVGSYWVHLDEERFQSYRSDPTALEGLFRAQMLSRLEEWVGLAEERLEGSPCQVLMAPGNDDDWGADEVIRRSHRIVPANDGKVRLGEWELITCAWSNPTPWQTPREKPEEELEILLDSLVATLEDPQRAIFNFHVPPYGTTLDLAPALSKDLIQAVERKVHVGSRAVASVVQRIQPPLGLFGHIHESRAAHRLGHTLCLNPGSEYSEGILRGVLVTLEKGRVRDHIFTSG